MDRIDYRQVFREVYAPPRADVVRVDVPPRRCLALDGEGPSEAPAFAEAVAAVRLLAKALRQRLKHGPMALDFRVMPLEVAWPEENRWSVLIFQPPVVDAALVSAEQNALLHGNAPVALAHVGLRHLPETPALQTLHTGDLRSVDAALGRLQAVAALHGVSLAPGYHAIDLGDPRTPPFSGGKTLIRRNLAV